MKLSSFTIYLMAAMIALAFFSFAYFMKVSPLQAETDNLKDVTAKTNIEAAKLPQAQERVRKALAMFASQVKEWRAISAVKTPNTTVATGGINLAVNAFQLSVDTKAFRNNIQRAVNAQIRKGGIKVINGPFVPGPDVNAPASSILASFYNYSDGQAPVVIFDLGTVTVQGTYQQILANVRAYKSMPHYLAVTDGLRLDGTSPNLTGTYNLTILGFLRAPLVNGEAPEGQGGGAAQGGFGAPGRGGPPGMPPGMGPGRAGPPGGMGGPPGGGGKGAAPGAMAG